MAHLCLTLTAPTWEGAARQIRENRSWITMAEVRLDLLLPAEREGGLSPGFQEAAAGLPLILTARLPRDGGRWQGTEAERLALMARCLKEAAEPFAWVDLEEEILQGAQAPLPAAPLPAAARRRGTKILASFHDFQGLPADLEARVDRMAEAGGLDAVKAAVTPRSSGDLRRLLALGRRGLPAAAPPLVLVGMGELGQILRILAAPFGSPWSYASPPGPAAAPGQLTPQVMEELYRYSRITPATNIFGIIGSPLGQSRSPGIHNPAFARAGLDAVYLPLPIPSLEPGEGADNFRALADELPLQGFSVTVPYKERIIPLLDEPDQAVRSIGACNTVFRTPGKEKGGLAGTNTDAPGFLAALKRAFPPLMTSTDAPRRALLLGAGGAARALLYALRREDWDVLVVNRTYEKARALAAEMGARAAPAGPESRERVDPYASLIIQSTSAGMPPLEDQDPLAWYPLEGHECLMDIVYKPPVTRLMERAARAGCAAVNGLAMLEEQGALQFALFRQAAEGPGMRVNKKEK